MLKQNESSQQSDDTPAPHTLTTLLDRITDHFTSAQQSQGERTPRPSHRPGRRTPAADPRTTSRAPRNRTDATAVVFPDDDGEGDTSHTLKPGAGASERLLLRSVVFS